jgi:hypothetical protein
MGSGARLSRVEAVLLTRAADTRARLGLDFQPLCPLVGMRQGRARIPNLSPRFVRTELDSRVALGECVQG